EPQGFQPVDQGREALGVVADGSGAEPVADPDLHSRLRSRARVRARSPWLEPNSLAAGSVTPASANARSRSAPASSSPMTARSAGPSRPSRSSIARYDGSWP